MAATPTLRPLAALRGSTRLTRGQGEAQRIVLKVDDALAPCNDGVALASEVMASARRMYTAAQNDALMVAGHEAARLHELAKGYRASFQRQAADICGTDDDGPVAA